MKPNPLAKANILSKLFFSYISPLLRIANKKKDVTPDDLYDVMPQDSSRYQSEKLLSKWKEQVTKSKNKGKKPSLLKALFLAYGPWYLFLAIGAISEEVLRITQPILLGLLIDYFSLNTEVTKQQAYLYAGLVGLNTLLLALVHAPYYWQIQRLGMNIRVALGTSVYDKVLCLSNKSLQSATVGKVSNIMTSDVNRFDKVFIYLHYLWLGPMEAIIILILLYREISWACLPGYAIMLFLFPTQAWMGKLFSKLRRKTAQFTDKRVAVMTEIITAIRVIKMYAWENAFGKIIQQIRESEVAKIITASYAIGTNLLLSLFGNRLLDVGMIITYALTTEETISASTIFVVVSFCRTLSGSFMRFFPRAMQMASECLVAIDRVEKILLLEEKETGNADDSSDLPDGVHIQAKNVYCKWNEEEAETDTLRDVSFEVKKGQLTAVIGPVGCGKSSLLMSIIKELPIKSGSLKVQGSSSFASQQPWVFSGTVRDNILFGKPFNEDLFKRIIQVCALKRDLELLPDGEETLIGERGVTLSGGQKARINLARALYDEPDIILLDDPLSAVDSEVGRHIFDQCIMGYLANKPRILVTHQLQYLTTADQIIILKDGHIEGKGTLSELNEMGIDFAKLMEEGEEDDEDDIMSLKSAGSARRKKKDKEAEKEKTENVSQKLFKAEEKKRGDVGWSVYGKYFHSGTNWFGIFLMAFFLISTQVIYLLADYWLAVWADLEEARAVNKTDIPEDNLILGYLSPPTETSALIYGLLVVGLMILGLFRGFYCLRVMITASKNLHNKMFIAVVRSPVFFFDTNPTGRIQNRFTKDISIMDDQLPLDFFDVLQLCLQILGVILLNAIINYYTLILILPLLVFFVFLRRYAVNTTRPVKRLDGTARSPVFSHTTASIFGLSTIRAYHKEEQFREKLHYYQDKHTEAWFAYLVVNRWFGLRLDILSFIFTAGVSFASVLASGGLDAGLVGVILNNTIALATIFQYTIRQTALVENEMTSVERVLEYTKLKPEAPVRNSLNRPPSGWPDKGRVTFKDMSLQYSKEAPYILRDISCDIQPKEKVGIVGRTGAGKSSLITALFRFAEPKGDITIDEISCMGLGLHDLRKKLSIIPQDPVLFKGSLRRNLDPFHKYTDEEIWNALKDVQLNHALEERAEKLEMDVGSDGSNFSVGQRQLVCLARAILRKNKILILDEATANVDPRTDALIQDTIRTKFAECTVLTIAHRLNTIMDSDRVMVLDAGELKEFEHPHILLQDKESLFSKLVEQVGKQEASRLADIARESFTKDEVIPLEFDEEINEEGTVVKEEDGVNNEGTTSELADGMEVEGAISEVSENVNDEGALTAEVEDGAESKSDDRSEPVDDDKDKDTTPSEVESVHVKFASEQNEKDGMIKKDEDDSSEDEATQL